MYNNSVDETSTILVTYCARQRRVRQALVPLNERKLCYVLIAHVWKILDGLTIELPRHIRETLSEIQNAVLLGRLVFTFLPIPWLPGD